MTNKLITYFAFEMKNFTSTSCCSKGDNGLNCEVVDDDVKGESCIPLFLDNNAIINMFVYYVRTYVQYKTLLEKNNPENYVGLKGFPSENKHSTQKNVRQKVYASV